MNLIRGKFALLSRALILGLLVSLSGCENSHKITFDSDGGSTIESQNVNNGELAYRPNNPTKYQHDFRFWSESRLQVQAFDFNTPITQDITLFAIYSSWSKPTVSQINSSFNISLDGTISRVGTNSNYYVSVDFTFVIRNVSNKNYLNFDLVVNFLWIMENDYEYAGQVIENFTLLDAYGEPNRNSIYEINKSGYTPDYIWSTYYNFDVAFEVVSVY
jgi:hypothetical protein